MRVINLFRTASITLPLMANSLFSAPIPGLFNTGIGTNGTALTAGAVDPHYRLVQSADTAYRGPNTLVLGDTSYPIPPWLPNSAESKWIAPRTNQVTGNQPGNYKYRLVFDLKGLEPTTAVITGRWATDDSGADILLNGNSTGITQNSGFTAFSEPFTINSGFVEGTNTLEFMVSNGGSGLNPTGLRVEVSGTAEVIPASGVAPSIREAPASQHGSVGGSVIFTVSAAGSRPFSYQWRLNSQPLPNATNATLVLNNLSLENSGNYQVVVSNAWGVVITGPALLTVSTPTPAQLTYEPLGPSSRRTGLALSEIMYHPRDRADGRNLEFIELYNSNPFAEDISGYHFSGDWSYRFPSNTVVPGKGFVLLAPRPADVEAVYGLSGVLGGFTNSLPNGSGTIRLHKGSGAIVLEVAYSDQPPWPAAADGTGHSLALARASYGEKQPQAWAASALIGGSPGTADPLPIDPLDHVVINEFLAHTQPPLQDFIELYNHSPTPVNLSGCWLTDSPNTNKFRLPEGVVLEAAGFIAFTQTQLGFALNAEGETIYLVNSNQTRVLDAVRFTGQASNISQGRFPDGAASFHALSERTPGAANAPLLLPEVVLNEIMYHPISELDDDEYVELHNRTATPVNIGGWRFTDGITFTIPAGASIPAGGYFVVAKNKTRFMTNYPAVPAELVAGNFSGTLSNQGEHLALARPETVVETNAQSGVVTTNTFFVTVNEVTYADGGRWGQWSDGGGSSLELVDAHSDNRLASNWADSDESAKAPWTTVEQTGRLDLPHSSSTSANQLQLFLQGAGEALVDNVEAIGPGNTNRITNSGFESGTTGWVFQGTQRLTSRETTEGYQSSSSLHVRASDRGDHVANRVRVPFSPAIPQGGIGTLRAKVRWLRGHPEILIRLKGGHLEAVGKLILPTQLGTPGLPNSLAKANAGPAIYNVSHRPVLPQAGQTIRVTARVDDPDGVISVILKYRIDPSAAWLSLPMVDDGSNGDLVAGDGEYTARIPGQNNNALVLFRVEAMDNFNPPAMTTLPTAADRYCLVRVGDVMPTNAFGTYRFWMTQAAHTFWGNREKMSNEDVDVTFVYGTNRVIYNAGGHFSGSSYTSPGYSTPTGALCGYDLNFPDDEPMLGDTHITLDWPIRDDTDQREQLMYWFLEQFGLPNCYRRYVNLYVNGIKRGTIYDDVQQPSQDMLDEWYPDDSNGNLYKTDCWNEFDDLGNRVDPCILNSLENFTSDGVKKMARYRWNWRPRAIGGSANHFEDLFTLVDVVNAQGGGYQAAVEAYVDVPHWMRTFAMNDLASFWDAFGNPNAKNTFIYKPQNDGWKLLSWDFDVGLGVFNDQVDSPLFPAGIDPTVQRMYNTPAMVRYYWQAMDEAVYGFFQTGAGTAIDKILDAKYAAFQANGIALTSPAGIKSWINQRRTFLLKQLNTVSNVFNVTGPTTFTTNVNSITLAGTAPVRINSILVNGVVYPITWTNVTNWRMRVPLQPGVNELQITALDRDGQPITNGTRTVRVTYTGTPDLPETSVVINEIMYHPQVPEASYVELLNTSTSTSFDLSNWRLEGTGFTFPPGTVLTNGQFMVMVKNRTAFASVHGFGVPVIGEYSGQLDDGGETLRLLRPGANAGEEILVDMVTYDDDAPWPASADGNGPSLQLMDPKQDNNRVSNWTEGDGWRFVSFTGNIGTATLPRLSLYFETAGGDVYLDDFALVSGEVPEVGSNHVQNSGFETPLAPNWLVGSLAAKSVIDPTLARSGSASLHLIVDPGNQSTTTFYQDLLPVDTNATYTLSFWWRPGNSGTNLNARINAAFKTAVFTKSSPFTPAAPNSSQKLLPPFPAIWLSEIAPASTSGFVDNMGENEPWLELFYNGSNPLLLDHYYLANNYTNLTQWRFPTGASMQPGQFLTLWADNEPGETTTAAWHVNFRLNGTGGTVVLSRLLNGEPQILDYINYGSVPANQSFGSFPDGQNSLRQVFPNPTPGGTNNAVAKPVSVFINEWMAANTTAIQDPTDGVYEDWFELYNRGTEAVDLSGYSLTDSLSSPQKFIIPQGTVISAGDFLLIWADEDTSENQPGSDLHANFKLSQGGELIALLEPGMSGRIVDMVSFGAQTNNVSQGRWPDGNSEPFFFMTVPTPGNSNVRNTQGIQIKRIEVAGNLITISWASVPGNNYRVLFKSELNQPSWIDISGILQATGEVTAWTRPLNPDQLRGFFKIQSAN